MLVRRHGPMVWRLCRRVVGESEAAQDAFQATFLVLVRKAASIRRPAALAAWLHRTAFRIACTAKDARRQRAVHPMADRPAATADPCHQAAWRELGAILEQEVHALPEKLRLPLLLCYWQGLTNDEAADRLGWPSGTLKARLTRARERLHIRLVQRGVTLPVGALALLLAPGDGDAALPVALMEAAMRAMGAGQGGSVGAGAATLAKLACQSGPMANAKLAVALAAVVGLSVLVAAGVWSRSAVGTDANRQPDLPRQVAAAAAQPQTNTPKQTHTDRYGDPLPAGALLRLGTLRHRALIRQRRFCKTAKPSYAPSMATWTLPRTPFSGWTQPPGASTTPGR